MAGFDCDIKNMEASTSRLNCAVYNGGCFGLAGALIADGNPVSRLYATPVIKTKDESLQGGGKHNRAITTGSKGVVYIVYNSLIGW